MAMMMRGLSGASPFIQQQPSGSDFFNAYKSAKTFSDQQASAADQDAANMAAGDLAAKGDLTGAANEYFRRGYQEAGQGYLNMARQKEQDAVAAQRRAEEATALQQTRGINALAATDPQAAAEQAIKLSGPNAAAPYAKLADDAARYSYNVSNRTYDVLNAATTPEQWNRAVDLLEAGVQHAGGNPAQVKAMTAHIESMRVPEGANFDEFHAGHLQGLDVERGMLRERLGIPSPEGQPGTHLPPVAQKGGAQKVSDFAQTKKEVADAYRAQYGKNLPPDKAASAANAITSKFTAGLTISGWEHDADGNPTIPIYNAPSNTPAAARANVWNTEAQFARSRAQRSGIKQADADQRASYVTAALGHLRMADEHLQEPGMDDVIGAIHGNERFQKYRGSLFPSDVETPQNYGRLRQDLESAQAEIERVYTAGQGVVTDHEREALKGLVVAIKDAPNVQSARAMVANARELIGEILATPTIRDVADNPSLKAQRERGMRDVETLINKGKLQPGTVKNGYRFKGGDPAQPESWEQVR